MGTQKLLDELDLDEKTKSTLLSNITRRLTPQAVKIRADIEVSCYAYDGIDAVKNSLLEGLKCTSEDVPIKINLIAAPLYVITTTTLDRDEGLQALTNAVDAIRTTIKKYGGDFNEKAAPKVVTDSDEAELAKQMERLERENAEVDGDDDNPDEEEISEEIH